MLKEMLASHGLREVLLGERIRQAGAELPTSSGVRGAFAKAVHAGANLLGDGPAIAALEQDEAGSLAFYAGDLESCDARTRTFIHTQILPLSQHTHDLSLTLK